MTECNRNCAKCEFGGEYGEKFSEAFWAVADALGQIVKENDHHGLTWLTCVMAMVFAEAEERMGAFSETIH